MKLSVHIERWPTVQPFRISGKTWDYFESVVVELEQNGVIGRGEALGVYYLNETAETMLAQISQKSKAIRSDISRATLQGLLPPGGARNAVDCALWYLEAKSVRRSIFDLSGVKQMALDTVFTIGIEETPQVMAAKAAAASAFGLLNIKLDGSRPAERLEAIRRARPDARMVVDANQGWSFSQLVQLGPICANLGVQMIEQPLRRGNDAELDDYESPVPLCADESCLHLDELDPGGAALPMDQHQARQDRGLDPCAHTGASSARPRTANHGPAAWAEVRLPMAPAFVIGCLADLVDIDGPLLQLKFDRLRGLGIQRRPRIRIQPRGLGLSP